LAISLGAYVTALARWHQLERLLANTPGTLADVDKRRIVRLAARERADAMKIGAQFGLGSSNQLRFAGNGSGKFSGLIA
jgi:hypothetical protein